MTPQQLNQTELCFGSNRWHLSIDHRLTVVGPPELAIVDFATAVDEALSNPIGLDGLEQVIVTGDTVALAVDPMLPASDSLVSAVAQWLVEHSVTPDNLTIVYPSTDRRIEQLASRLAGQGLQAVQVVGHDWDDSNAVSYLAADEDAQSIYINRVLVDADVVIPLCCTRSSLALDNIGPFSIFPWFTNRQAHGEFFNYASLTDNDHRSRLVHRAEQAARWLGAFVSIQASPAVGNRLSGIVSGLLDEVYRQDKKSTTSEMITSSESPLIIACVDQDLPSWFSVAKSLHAAVGCCRRGGAIVLCTELSGTIGPSLRRLREASISRQQIVKRLSKDSTQDTLLAGAIVSATTDHHLYLVSTLRDDTVESLGLAVLANEEQLHNLSRQFSECTVIRSAQHC